MNNFSGAEALIAGLRCTAIRRLKRTWGRVSSQVQATLSGLENTFDTAGPYKVLLSRTQPPCVPSLRVYLRELSLIQKESTDIIEVGGKGGSSGTKLINFEKRQWVNDILQHILKFQSQPYNLNKIPAIRKFIEDGLAEMDNIPDLLSLSTLTEPDDKEDEKMVRLLQESGFT